MIKLTQIYDTGPTAEDRPIWVNPKHMMYMQQSDDDATITVIAMADGWTFRCRESAYLIGNLL